MLNRLRDRFTTACAFAFFVLAACGQKIEVKGLFREGVWIRAPLVWLLDRYRSPKPNVQSREPLLPVQNERKVIATVYPRDLGAITRLLHGAEKFVRFDIIAAVSRHLPKQK